ncbi:MAG: hypothetical protein E7312_03595 [Clostridiales bacterium]|nr:hypothetical protein [Clostridiales bacterium]
MKYAIIDIGTNSVRYLLARYDGIAPVTIFRDRENTRLGKGLYSEARLLAPDTMKQTALAVAKFVLHARQNNAESIICFATSAVRDANNSNVLADMIKEQAGVDLEVLSGDEEALAGYTGAMSDDCFNCAVLVDIGGGSTEIIERLKTGTVMGVSFDCGCVRLKELFGDDIEGAKQYIEQNIHVPQGKSIVLIGGTATTLAMLYNGLSEYNEAILHGTHITLQYIEELTDKVMNMTPLEREELVAFDRKRADILLYGLLIISYIARMTGASGIVTSEQGLMQGIIKLKHKSK